MTPLPPSTLTEDEIDAFMWNEHDRANELAERFDYQGAGMLLENCQDCCKALKRVGPPGHK